MVAVLGGVSTILASYLAKVRGSGEPEFSSIRGRELSSFLREVHAFVIDDGSSLFFHYFVYYHLNYFTPMQETGLGQNITRE